MYDLGSFLSDLVGFCSIFSLRWILLLDKGNNKGVYFLRDGWMDGINGTIPWGKFKEGE